MKIRYLYLHDALAMSGLNITINLHSNFSDHEEERISPLHGVHRPHENTLPVKNLQWLISISLKRKPWLAMKRPSQFITT
jgi:hypothetical protein